MRKYVLMLLMLSAVVLTGCLPQVQATQTPTATTKARPNPTVSLNLPPEVLVPVSADCTVKTLRPTPGPTAETIYPPVSDTDRTEGLADAKVTIIEYSDFQ